MILKKPYYFISFIWLMGVIWLFINFSIQHKVTNDQFSVCIIKNTTGVPCPSCGTTRSVNALMEGNISKAAFINPLGLLAAIVLALLPFWLLVDFIFKKDSLVKFYQSAENRLKKGYLLQIVLIGLILINWIWNIHKNL